MVSASAASDQANPPKGGVNLGVETTEIRVPKTLSYKGLPIADSSSGWYILSPPDSPRTVKMLFVDFYVLDKSLMNWGEVRPINLSEAQFRAVIDARNIAAFNWARGSRTQEFDSQTTSNAR
jgi:hypothetical protein